MVMIFESWTREFGGEGLKLAENTLKLCINRGTGYSSVTIDYGTKQSLETPDPLNVHHETYACFFGSK
jgi:hypothetical protein